MAAPIPNADRVTSYAPSSSTTTFEVGFVIFSDETADLEVWHNGERVTSGWSLNATFDEGRSDDAEIVFDDGIEGDVVIVGSRQPRREVGYEEGRGVTAADLNKAVDTLTSVDRELKEEIGRAVRAPGGDDAALHLAPKNERANRFFVWDENGEPTPTEFTAEDLFDARDEAESAASAAATSASNAAASEANAADSATSAAGSAAQAAEDRDFVENHLIAYVTDDALSVTVVVAETMVAAEGDTPYDHVTLELAA